ncbi:hypothetical protein NL676_025908 [Syzygium grande]|nr:hypothetical protein NL676_025908 [Syzygium grande]
MSASYYYSRFTTLCEKLDTYLPATDDIRELAKRQQDMRVVLFLRELGPTHSSLRQQIISQGTLPSVDEQVLWSLSLSVAVEAEDVVLGVVAGLSFFLVVVEMVVGVLEVLVIATIVSELAILSIIVIPYILSFIHGLLLPKQ